MLKIIAKEAPIDGLKKMITNGDIANLPAFPPVEDVGGADLVLLGAGEYVQLKSAADELHRSKNSIISSGKLSTIGHLSSQLIHDIGNPLTTIRMAVMDLIDAVKNENYDREEFVDTLQKLSRNVDNITAMTKQMLIFSTRGDSGYERLNANDVVMDSVRFMSPHFKNTEMLTDIADAPLEFYGNRTKLEILLTNILLNAKESLAGSTGAEKRLSISTRPDGTDWIRVVVEDNGTGMKEGSNKRLVNPFFSSGDSEAGIGLAIADRIIEEHKGKIEVDNRTGAGTRVTILLPKDRRKVSR
jgi:signal transduction histidine kinase